MSNLEKNPYDEVRQPPRHVVAKDRIRQAVDPNSQRLPDDVIFRVLLNVGGDLRRATHKCILIMQAEAMRKQDGTSVLLTRDLLRMHEAGLLLEQT